MPPKPPRQEVCWVSPTRKIALEQKPKRVWTLFYEGDKPDPERPPELPIVPRHNVNAFLEDYVHDWDWRNGTLFYYSRVVRDSIWILCEFEVKS